MSPRTAAMSPAVVALPAPTAPTAPTGAYCGVVKSFNDQRGFGWLSCPAAGRDVFVHVNDLSRPEDRMLLPFAPNTVLQFDIAHRPRGLSAVNVTVVHAAVAAAPVAAAPIEAKEALAIRPRRLVASSASRAPLPDVSPDERFRGTIVYYAATKGFGFVQSASLPSKVYLHVYSVEKYGAHELEIGMSVEFSVRENAKGKYAGAIKVLHQNGDAFEEAPYGIEMWPGRHRGVLRSYDPKRTLGWVSCGNTEVLMHIYELRQHDAEERLVDGLVLEFSVGMHGRGATAYDIDIIEDAMPISPVARVAPLTANALVQEIVAAKSVHLRSPFAPVVPPSLKPILASAATVTPSSAPLSHRSLVGTPYMPADLRSPISPAGSTAPPSPVRSPSPSTRSSSPLSLAENSGDEFGAIGDRRSPSSATSPLSSSSNASAANIFCDPANNLWDAFQKGLSAEQGSTVDAYWGSVFKAFVNPWSTL